MQDFSTPSSVNTQEIVTYSNRLHCTDIETERWREVKAHACKLSNGIECITANDQNEVYESATYFGFADILGSDWKSAYLFTRFREALSREIISLD